MSNETLHEVKPAAAVLADDVICQSFIQSSSTLAYACLLIRRKRYDLASHVLHSLEAKQASRFKDMVFYLQAQIGIETGEYAMVKKRLVPRVHLHPNDMVALSLLECCIHLEWIERARTSPAPEPPTAEAEALMSGAQDSPVLSDSAFGNAAVPPAVLESRPVAASAAAVGYPRITATRPAPAPTASSSGAHEVAAAIASAPPASSRPVPVAESDVGIYQPLANDGDTRALVVWNAGLAKMKSSCRDAGLANLAALLPQSLPAPFQAACARLEGGVIHKICFSFQNLTVTTFHAGQENLGLVTGNINQSLLTLVRAENTFRKQAAMGAAAQRPAEYVPNE